ncbi:hypothetical protein [Leisingera sp. ANG-DT]|uniref:hypothetical protein n=1 Tax=Leisingera sp. ANG-DT TaxID=1577897 RepID=UPI00057D9931|nr:hypothetical protein [Leisingera sp. ANG-DT]KIC18513.1 hypothetical protein RA21_04455 [Leisingera sp. ANG-DT]
MGIRILAGEGLRLGKHDSTKVLFGQLQLKKEKGWFATCNYSLTQVAQIETVDEENYRTLGATAGWGLVGIALAGPFGAVLGGYFGGKKNLIVAAVEMDDGLRFLAEFSPASFRKLTKHYKHTEALQKTGFAK